MLEHCGRLIIRKELSLQYKLLKFSNTHTHTHSVTRCVMCVQPWAMLVVNAPRQCAPTVISHSIEVVSVQVPGVVDLWIVDVVICRDITPLWVCEEGVSVWRGCECVKRVWGCECVKKVYRGECEGCDACTHTHTHTHTDLSWSMEAVSQH